MLAKYTCFTVAATIRVGALPIFPVLKVLKYKLTTHKVFKYQYQKYLRKEVLSLVRSSCKNIYILVLQNTAHIIIL